MDVVTLQAAAAAAKRRYVSGAGSVAVCLKKLQKASNNVEIVVYGDSTGNDANEWVYLLMTWLAAKFPAYSFDYYLWNDTNKNYDAVVHFQVGNGTTNAGGPFLCTIHNASTPGQNVQYTKTWGGNQTPTTPDVAFFNYGHNQTETGAAVGQVYVQTVQVILNRMPGTAGVVIVGQNPRTDTAANALAHLKRMDNLAAFAATNGLGFVDVTQAFLDTPSWQSLINADGIHPLPAGQILWASVVEQLFVPSYTVTPRAPAALDYTIWVPFTAFYPVDVSAAYPQVEVFSSLTPALSFTHGATVTAAAVVNTPWYWQDWSVVLKWAQSDTGTGNVKWGLDTCDVKDSTALAWTTDALAQATSAAAGVANREMFFGFTGALGWTLVSPSTRAQRYYKVKRMGADVADTYTGTARLLGMLLTRTD